MANNKQQSKVDELDDDLEFIESDRDVCDNDDILFDCNVSEGIELGMRNILHNEVALDYDSSSNASSEELEIGSGSESKENIGKLSLPEFIPTTGKQNPELEIGLLFGSFEELKSAVRNHAVFNRVEPILKRKDKDRFHCACKEGCSWKLWASKLQGQDTIQIKTYDPDHACLKVHTNKYVTYRWLVDYYLEDFRADPEWKTKYFRSRVRKDLGVHVTKTVPWNTRKYAKVLVEGNDARQFALLGCYAEELRRTNPGSTVIILRVENVFRGIYVCIEACKRGFIQGCRHFVSIDGCFLKGKYGDQHLAAVGVDANDCTYPIAYVVVEKENTSSWRWFLMLLSENLAMKNWMSITFMSDRQKGLINVVAELFPQAKHKFCVRHMYQNFFIAGFKGKQLKDNLWGAAKSSHLGSFKYWMAKIENVNDKTHEWLMERTPNK